MERNGMEWSGMEWSGVEWNGMEWSGMEWSGLEWNELLVKNGSLRVQWLQQSPLGAVASMCATVLLLMKLECQFWLLAGTQVWHHQGEGCAVMGDRLEKLMQGSRVASFCISVAEACARLTSQGFLCVAVAAIVLFFLLFRAGKLLSGPILRWRDRKAKLE